MPLPDFSAEVAWQDVIEGEHAHFRKAVISVYDPANRVGGVPATVLSRRAARIQQLRAPSIVTGAGDEVTKRSFLFELKLEASDNPVTKDMLIRVHDGGRDPQLELYGFTVVNSVNSSEAAVRTIEAATEFAILKRIP